MVYQKLIVFELFYFEHCKIAILGYVCRLITFVDINIFYSYTVRWILRKFNFQYHIQDLLNFELYITMPQAYKQIALTRGFAQRVYIYT